MDAPVPGPDGAAVLALGFRKPSDAPYEIAMAAFSAEPAQPASLCGVFQYVQP